MKLEAEVYGALLALDLIEPKDVVRWADAIVAEEGATDPSVLAISVNGRGDRFDRLDAINALSRVPGVCTAIDVTNALLGVLERWLEEDRSPAIAARVSTIVYEIANGLSTLPLRIDDENRAIFMSVDRELSQLDASEHHRALAIALRPYARYAQSLRSAPHLRLPR